MFNFDFRLSQFRLYSKRTFPLCSSPLPLTAGSASYTVSINVLSVRLNRSTPLISSTMVATADPIKYLGSTVPAPRSAYRYVSTMPVMGLSETTHRKRSGTSDSGYTTGVAYIHNWVRNPVRCAKSRYLAVKDDIHSPTPSPMAAVCRSRRGRAKR